MTQNTESGPLADNTAPMFSFHFKLIAKIAAYVGFMAMLGWAAVVFYLTSSSGGSYFDVIRAFSVTQQKLSAVMWASGLLFLGVVGFLTWAISLYSSFRIAGPLFRFSRNLEMVCEKGPVPILGIRATDKLQEESELLVASIERLGTHYGSMATLVDRAQVLLDSDKPEDREQLQKILGRIRELEVHVQL